MTDSPAARFRVLFLCTGNSARSQMAEAVLNRKGAGRFEAHSAGSRPAAEVNALAVWALRESGIEWRGHTPRGLEAVQHDRWDFVITVCDRARESCPVFPRHPITAHWGMPDPAAVTGPDGLRRAAFIDTLTMINCRIDLLLALPVEKLARLALQSRLREIGAAQPDAESVPDPGDQSRGGT